MAKEKEDSHLVWNWIKKSFTVKSETDIKESSLDPKKHQWTSPEPRPSYPGTAKVDKDSLAPEGFSPLPFVCEDMEGFDVVVWDVQTHEWQQGTIDEVYLNETEVSTRGAFLIYVVVTTSRGKLKAYTLESIRIVQQSECKVEVAA